MVELAVLQRALQASLLYSLMQAWIRLKKLQEARSQTLERATSQDGIQASRLMLEQASFLPTEWASILDMG